jgi:hypothetical protein
MPRAAKTRDVFRPASNRKLWRLNTLGRLKLAENAEPIRAAEASALIAAAAESQRFDAARADYRHRAESAGVKTCPPPRPQN